ncbi:MAG: hypothetical protein BMS9Abin19_0762 [Gammaproteobacteria bacterium]|nr:MAG: hypothetical protein BMS9Abin19_0762 [Gammaproteobacteria bacterium]
MYKDDRHDLIRFNFIKRALRGLRQYKNVAMTVALIFLFITPQLSSADKTSPEYAVKAAYIFNILRFVESADNSLFDDIDEINICILGESKFGQYITPIETKQIENKPLRILKQTSLQQTQQCQLVFIGNTQLYLPEEVSKVLGDKKVIVVGDDMDFVKNGGMFAFYVENKKVRLGINKDTLDKSGLKASSLLLEVATAFGDSK